MSDRFAGYAIGPDAPATTFVAITPANADLAEIPRGIYVGGAGDLAVLDGSGNTVTFKGLVAGMLLPIRPVRVLPASTVTFIIGLS